MCISITVGHTCWKAACRKVLEPTGKMYVCKVADESGDCCRGIYPLSMESPKKRLCRKCVAADQATNQSEDTQGIVRTAFDLERRKGKRW